MPESSRSSPSLKTLQHWIQAVIVHPDRVSAALVDPAVSSLFEITAESLGQVILPSSTLTSVERLGIYAGMYPLRMREALSSDYPVLKHRLGLEAFEHLVDAYVQVHPSRHANLNQLGCHLPDFIRVSGPRKDRAFLAELAALELAVTKAFDAQDSARANVADLLHLTAEQWADAVFVPVPALQLLEFKHPVNAYFQAVKDERDPGTLEKVQNYVAVYRVDYKIWRRTLTRPMYRVLKLLMEGRTVEQALLKGAKAGGTDLAGLAQNVRVWFREWMEDGWFSEIKVKSK